MDGSGLVLGVGMLALGVACSASKATTEETPAPALEASAKQQPGPSRHAVEWRRVNDTSSFALAQAAQRVVVDRERVSFVDQPDLDLAEAPSFALKRLSRDDRREVLEADPYPRGRELVLYRGQAEEHLERVPNGVEHSFHFASKPSGGGDLVVDLETSGLGLLGSDAQGLHFRAGDKLIHYGTATWVDAKGARSPVALSHANGSIRLRVAAKVLEGSAYPVVLDPLIQTEFIVAHARKKQPVPSRSGCTANQCLHVWNDGHFVFGRRTSFSGDWVEPEAHRLMRGDYYPQRVSAAPNGDYLVTVSAPTSAAVVGFVVHSDMSVDSDAPDLLYANDSPQYMQQPAFEGAVVSQGVHHLFYQAWNADESEMHRFVLRVKDGEALGPPIDLGRLDDNYEVPSFSAGATSVIVTQNNRVLRIDAATGNLLDASPVKVSNQAEDAFASRLSSTFDGENFVILWTNGNTGRVHAARLRESDGVLLDAQGVGATGSRVLCSAFISYASVDGNVHGGRVQLLLWKGSGDPDPSTVVATSVATDGWTSSDASCGGTELGEFQGESVVFGGNQARLGGKALTFANDGASSQALPVPGFTTSRRFGGVVSNGRDFLLLSEPIERIDGATGALLGSVTVPNVASVGASQVFPDGADYLVRGDDRTIRRLRCDGTLGPTHRSQVDALSCNGEHCLGWINYTRYQETPGHSVVNVAMTDIFRFDRSGKSIGTSVARFNNGYSDQPSGAGALAVGSGSSRQFVLARPLASSPTSTALTLIDSGTGLVSETSFPTPNEGFTLATDGSRLAWFYPNEARLTDLVGSSLGQRSFAHGWTGKPPTYQAQTFDGFSYLVRTATKVVLLDESLADSQQMAFQATNSDEGGKQYYASNSFGRTLLARTAYVDEDGGQAVVAQFLDNDLAPADPSNAPSNCAVSGPIDEQPNAYAAIYVTTGNGGAGGSTGSNTSGAAGSTSAGSGGSINAGGSATAGGSAGADNAAGSDGEMPSAEGGTSAEGGSGARDAIDSGGEASAVGGSGGSSHAGNAAVPPREKPRNSTGGGCSYAPSSPSHSSWLWLLGLVVIAQRRRSAN